VGQKAREKSRAFLWLERMSWLGLLPRESRAPAAITDPRMQYLAGGILLLIAGQARLHISEYRAHDPIIVVANNQL